MALGVWVCRGTAQTLKYDAENRLVKISQGTAYVIRMAYDGDGKRAKRVDNNGTIHYAGPHYERNVGTGSDTTEAITKLYYAQIGPYRRLVAFRRAGVLNFVHSDHLGSTAILSDTSGNEVGSARYQSYGQTRTQSGSISTDKLYTGQTLDASSALYFYEARYFDSALGRFLAPDSIVPNPANPQSLNRFSYALNNPLNLIDPTGHAEQGPGYQPEDGPFYMFVGGYGTNDQADHSEWDPMIGNLGLDPGRYAYFDWAGGWSGQGTASVNRSVADAAPELARQIGNHQNVTLVGHSKGGALIAEYLAQIAEGNPGISANRNVKNAFAIDSPLEGFSAWQVGFDRFDASGTGTIAGRDRLADLSGRLAQKGMEVRIATLDNPNDWVGHGPIPNIPYYALPLGNFIAGHEPATRAMIDVHGNLMTSPEAARVIRDSMRVNLVAR